MSVGGLPSKMNFSPLTIRTAQSTIHALPGFLDNPTSAKPCPNEPLTEKVRRAVPIPLIVLSDPDGKLPNPLTVPSFPATTAFFIRNSFAIPAAPPEDHHFRGTAIAPTMQRRHKATIPRAPSTAQDIHFSLFFKLPPQEDPNKNKSCAQWSSCALTMGFHRRINP